MFNLIHHNVRPTKLNKSKLTRLFRGLDKAVRKAPIVTELVTKFFVTLIKE